MGNDRRKSGISRPGTYLRRRWHKWRLRRIDVKTGAALGDDGGQRSGKPDAVTTRSAQTCTFEVF